MRRGDLGRWAVPSLAAATALAVTVTATSISWDHMAPRRPIDLAVRLAGWAAIAAGAVTWWRGVRVPLARLLLLLGVAMFLRDLRESPVPPIADAGLVSAYLWTALAAHVTLAWPDGVLRGRAARGVVAACYLTAVGTQLMRLVDPGGGDRWPLAGSASAAVLSLVVVAVVARRWWLRHDDERPEELVVVGVAVVGLAAAWVALANLLDAADARMDAVPVVAGLGAVPVAVVAYLRLRAQLDDVRAARRQLSRALAEVQRSRRRLLEATAAERHRINHDLHEGAQQGLAAVQMLLREAERAMSATPDAGPARELLGQARTQLTSSIEELRDLVQGIYPVPLRDHGLAAALEDVARRSPVPLVLDITPRRWPHELEITAYFCVTEAVANVLKHAQATRIDVRVHDLPDGVVVRIADDGLGEALPPSDGGLQMLQDRVETYGGRITGFGTSRGSGTVITLVLPYPDAATAAPPEEA